MLALNGIARHLRAGRVANGALRLDNTKLYFGMDADGNPISAAPYGEKLQCFYSIAILTIRLLCILYSICTSNSSRVEANQVVKVSTLLVSMSTICMLAML